MTEKISDMTINPNPMAMSDLIESSVKNGSNYNTYSQSGAGILAMDSSRPSVLCATTAALVGTYNNGSSGIGATFTITATGLQTIDGNVQLLLNTRILMKDQGGGTGNPFQNGIYIVTTQGATGVSTVLTRATDYNTSNLVNQGTYVSVTAGVKNGGSTWLMDLSNPISIGSTAITFQQQFPPFINQKFTIQDPASSSNTGSSPTNTQLTIGGAATTSTPTTGIYARTSFAYSNNLNNAAWFGCGFDNGKSFPYAAIGYWIGGGSVDATRLQIYPSGGGITNAFIFLTTAGSINITDSAGINGLASVSTTTLTVNGFTWSSGGNVAFSGAFNFTGTLTAATNVTFPTSGTLATTAQLATETIINQTASYTLALTDAGALEECNSSSAITVTVPTNTSVAFAIGTKIDFVQYGTGKVTFAASGGVTINSIFGNLSIAAQYAGCSLTKMATDTWLLVGNLST